MRRTRSVFLGFLLTLLAGIVAVGSAHAEQGINIKYKGMDRNRDGRITRNEWRAAMERSFNNHDWNNDGILEGKEVRDWRDQDDEWNRYQYDGRWNQGQGWQRGRRVSGTYRSLDKNNDGMISMNEWTGSREEFDALDRDGNDQVTEVEIRTALFNRIDTNNDNIILPNEWSGPRRNFDALDFDRDGKLSTGEFIRRGNASSTSISSMDINRDGRISRSEWGGSVQEFNNLDINRDNYLSGTEYVYTSTETNSTDAGSLFEQIFQQFLSTQQ
ncbi:MAG TPA: hypothetical protein VD883_03840 [Candidatus Omnitrophota bacterium]|nr:hypothetical protein [Candidatus Omnitrophota bacterium]